LFALPPLSPKLALDASRKKNCFFLFSFPCPNTLCLSLDRRVDEIDDDESLMKNPGTRNRYSSSLLENGVV
jgi:hypothetical protein